MSFKRSETIALKLDLRHYWELSWMIKLPNFFIIIIISPSVSLNISSIPTESLYDIYQVVRGAFWNSLIKLPLVSA